MDPRPIYFDFGVWWLTQPNWTNDFASVYFIVQNDANADWTKTGTWRIWLTLKDTRGCVINLEMKLGVQDVKMKKPGIRIAKILIKGQICTGTRQHCVHQTWHCPYHCPIFPVAPPFRILGITPNSELRFRWSRTFHKAIEMLYKIQVLVFKFGLKKAPPWSPDCPVVTPPLFPRECSFWWLA
jgi:hypothetical protein